MAGNGDDETPPDSPLLMRVLEEKEENRQQLLDLLEEPIRRQVLHEFDPDEGPVALSDLAERVANTHFRGASAVASRSSDTDGPSGTETPTGPDSTETRADRVAIQLHHVHLPKLADQGLVEYDHREKIVTAKPPD